MPWIWSWLMPQTPKRIWCFGFSSGAAGKLSALASAAFPGDKAAISAMELRPAASRISRLFFISGSGTRRGMHDQAAFAARRVYLEVGIVRKPDEIDLVPGI